MRDHAMFDRVLCHSVRDVPEGGHERATLDWLGREVARLMGIAYDGLHVTAMRHPGAGFHVPDDTLTRAQADARGIVGDGDLLGGIVPRAFIATKVVSHPLVSHDATRVEGWCAALGEAITQATLPGFSVFDEVDALAAFARLGHGAVRLKLPSGVGGRGQWLIDDVATLRACLAGLPEDYLRTQGVVLERNLRDAVTFSVGEMHCAGIDIAYHGTQHVIRDADGCEVYGGSDLWVVRGSLQTLCEAPLTGPQREAVQQACLYDRFIGQAYPALRVSRRNYDVVRGDDATGQHHCGVLEQSWRVGGATPAELAAIAHFQRDPALHMVHACTHEVYDAQPLPVDADVYFAGVPGQPGPRCKYRTSVPIHHQWKPSSPASISLSTVTP